MKIVRAKILILLLLFPLQATHSEMRCMKPGTPLQELNQSSAVFSGKVIEIKYETMPDWKPALPKDARIQTVKISVAEYWKGELPRTVKLVTSNIELPNGITQMMSEDFIFKVNEQYLVYAYQVNDLLQTNGCTRTRLLEKADDDLKELGKGKIIAQ